MRFARWFTVLQSLRRLRSETTSDSASLHSIVLCMLHFYLFSSPFNPGKGGIVIIQTR